MIKIISGWFTRIAFAISFSKIVLPTRGAATIRPRCPRPSGESRSTARALIEFVFVFSSMIRPCGKSGVRLSNSVGSFHSATGTPSIDSISSNMISFSRSRGSRSVPRIFWAGRSLNCWTIARGTPTSSGTERKFSRGQRNTPKASVTGSKKPIVVTGILRPSAARTRSRMR